MILAHPVATLSYVIQRIFYFKILVFFNSISNNPTMTGLSTSVLASLEITSWVVSGRL